MRKIALNDAAQAKKSIQALVRDIVILRDGGCILRDVRLCGGEVGNDVVFQADHLITRANSATFADTRLIVCVCKRCHGWKHWHKEEYDELVKSILSPMRVMLWERCQRESWRPQRRYASDWRKEIAALQQELTSYL